MGNRTCHQSCGQSSRHVMGTRCRADRRRCKPRATTSTIFRTSCCLPQSQLSADFSAALAAAELVIIACPDLRPCARPCSSWCSCRAHFDVVWLCKGFEAETAKLPHQVVAEVLPEGCRYGVLSGPSFAQEVARGFPTALTLASADQEFARSTAQALASCLPAHLSQATT